MNDLPEQYRDVIKEIRRRGYKDPYFILRLARSIREWLDKAGMEWKPKDHDPPVCAGCGGVGKYRFNNGKWYCEKVTRKCPAIAAKIKETQRKKGKKK